MNNMNTDLIITLCDSVRNEFINEFRDEEEYKLEFDDAFEMSDRTLRSLRYEIDPVWIELYDNEDFYKKITEKDIKTRLTTRARILKEPKKVITKESYANRKIKIMRNLGLDVS